MGSAAGGAAAGGAAGTGTTSSDSGLGGASLGGAAGLPPVDPDEAWPQRMHDSLHTSRTTATVSASPQLLWRVKLDGSTDHLAPIVDRDQNVFAHTYKSAYSFGPTGSLRWTLPALTPGGATTIGFAGVAALPNGNLAVVDFGAELLRIVAPDGTVLRDQPVPKTIAEHCMPHQPVVGADGTIFLAVFQAIYQAPIQVYAPRVAAFASNGDPLWVTDLPAEYPYVESPTRGQDGSLYVVSGPPDSSVDTSLLIRISSSGQILATKKVPKGALPPSVSPDGRLNLGRGNADTHPEILKLDPDLSLVASTDLPTIGSTTPPVDLDGNLHVALACGFRKLSPTLSTLWQIGCSSPPDWFMHVWSRGSLTADGTFVVSDDTGALRGLRNGAIMWSVERETKDTGLSLGDSIAVARDGTIYAGSKGTNYLYAFR